jgi:hypothetical protein
MDVGLAYAFQQLGCRLSVLVDNRRVFVFTMTLGMAIRLALALLEPASFDLQNIGSVIFYSGAWGWGPWVFLDAQLVNIWRSFATSSTIGWGNTPPFTSPFDLQLLTLMLRLPSFLFDVATLVVVYYATLMLSASGRSARLAALLWSLNPYTFFAVELIGVPDIASTFLAVSSCVLFLRRKPILSGIALASGIALKLFPILILPTLVAYQWREKSSRLKSKVFLVLSGAVGLVLYLFWVFPPGSSPAVGGLLNYTPITQPMEMLFEFIPQSGGRVSTATAVLVVLFLGTWWFAGYRELITEMVPPVLLVYLALSNPYPSYFVWVIPFLTIALAINRRRTPAILFVGLLTFLMGFWFFFSGGFLTPSGYSLLMIPLKGGQLPWYSQRLNALLNDPRLNLLLPSLLAAALYATSVIYALEFMRGWFNARPSISEQSPSSNRMP